MRCRVRDYILLWGILATYNTFIHCLKQTKQHQVVKLMGPTLAGDIHPLCDELQSRLQRNYATSVRLINSKDGFTGELIAAECITWCQRNYIESATSELDSNKRLIDIVRRGSETDFYKFIECLNNNNQRHVSRILIEDGAVALIVANISPRDRRVCDSKTRRRPKVETIFQTCLPSIRMQFTTRDKSTH